LKKNGTDDPGKTCVDGGNRCITGNYSGGSDARDRITCRPGLCINWGPRFGPNDYTSLPFIFTLGGAGDFPDKEFVGERSASSGTSSGSNSPNKNNSRRRNTLPCNQTIVNIGNVIVGLGEAGAYAGGGVAAIGVAVAIAGLPVPEPFIETFGLGVAGVGFGLAAIGEGVAAIGAAAQGFGQGGLSGAGRSVASRFSAFSPFLRRFGPLGKAVDNVASGVNVADGLITPQFTAPKRCN